MLSFWIVNIVTILVICVSILIHPREENHVVFFAAWAVDLAVERGATVVRVQLPRLVALTVAAFLFCGNEGVLRLRQRQ